MRDALQKKISHMPWINSLDLGGAFGVAAKVHPAFVFLEEVLTKLSESDTEKASWKVGTSLQRWPGRLWVTCSRWILYASIVVVVIILIIVCISEMNHMIFIWYSDVWSSWPAVLPVYPGFHSPLSWFGWRTWSSPSDWWKTLVEKTPWPWLGMWKEELIRTKRSCDVFPQGSIFR